VRFIIALFACLSAFWGAAGTAYAVVPVGDEACTLSTPVDQTLSQILKSSAQFDCSDTKYDLDQPRKWLKTSFDVSALAPGKVELQMDTNGLGEVSIHAVMKNGAIVSEHFSEGDIKKLIRPKGFTGLPIPGSETASGRKNITTLYIALDNTIIDGSLTSPQLAAKEEWDQKQVPFFILFGLLIGMLIVPAIYTAIFSGAMRHKFLFWHFWRTLSAATFTLASSGIIFFIIPATALSGKLSISYGSLALGIFFSSLFLISIIERDKTSQGMKYAVVSAAMLPIVVSFMVLFVFDGYGQYSRISYFVSYAPFLFMMICTMVQAVRRGSKVAWLQIAAWLPFLFFGLDRIARALDIYDGWAIFDYGLYFALVLENLIIAFSLSFRVNQLRNQRTAAVRSAEAGGA